MTFSHTFGEYDDNSDESDSIFNDEPHFFGDFKRAIHTTPLDSFSPPPHEIKQNTQRTPPNSNSNANTPNPQSDFTPSCSAPIVESHLKSPPVSCTPVPILTHSSSSPFSPSSGPLRAQTHYGKSKRKNSEIPASTGETEGEEEEDYAASWLLEPPFADDSWIIANKMLRKYGLLLYFFQ